MVQVGTLVSQGEAYNRMTRMRGRAKDVAFKTFVDFGKDIYDPSKRLVTVSTME